MLYQKGKTLLGLSGKGVSASLVVSRTEEVSRKAYSWSIDVRNMDYDALLWYNITHKCVFQGYKAKTLSYVDGKDKKMNDIIRDAILPVRDVPIHIESLRDGCSITLTSTYDEYGPNSNIRNDRLVLDLIEANSAGLSWTMLISSKERDEMRTTHLNALRLFMVKVRGDYHAQLKSQEWEQTLYRMHVKYDDTLKKSTVEWKGNLTHSTKTFDTVIQFVNSNLKRPLGRLIFFIHVLCHNLAVLCTRQDLERLL